MPLPQISLFLENKPGRLASVCHALTDGGVNIASLSLADTSDFGIVRLLVDKPEAARDLLTSATSSPSPPATSPARSRRCST